MRRQKFPSPGRHVIGFRIFAESAEIAVTLAKKVVPAGTDSGTQGGCPTPVGGRSHTHKR